MERLLAAAAARVILLSFAADNRELLHKSKLQMVILTANLSCIHVSVNLACARRWAWQVQRAVDQSRSNHPRILSGLARSALLAWRLGNFDHVLRFACRLRKLTFGDRFDHDLHFARWPAEPETLCFGTDFHRSLQRMELLQGLRAAHIHAGAVQPSLQKVSWPAGLRDLTLKRCFLP